MYKRLSIVSHVSWDCINANTFFKSYVVSWAPITKLKVVASHVIEHANLTLGYTDKYKNILNQWTVFQISSWISVVIDEISESEGPLDMSPWHWYRFHVFLCVITKQTITFDSDGRYIDSVAILIGISDIESIDLISKFDISIWYFTWSGCTGF